MTAAEEPRENNNTKEIAEVEAVDGGVETTVDSKRWLVRGKGGADVGLSTGRV